MQSLRRFLKWGASLLILLLVGILGASQTTWVPHLLRLPHPPPLQPANDRTTQWEQDLHYFQTQLPRLHVAPFRQVTADEFQAAVARLSQQIDELNDVEIYTELSRLVALLADSHTIVAPNSTYITALPVVMETYADGVFIESVAEEYQMLAGGRVVAIEDMPIAEVFERLASYIPHDNPYWLHNQQTIYAIFPQFLQVASVTDDPESVTFTVVTPDENEIRREIEARALRDVLGEREDFYSVFGENPPLAEKHPDLNYWYEYLPEHQAVYLQYDRAANMSSMPFRGFVGELENALDENEVDRLVVDLRQNGGGASRMILPLVELIESRPGLNREGHLFVLVSNNTFSAAVINVNDFRQRTDATFIGLPTGGQPQSPGEVRPPYLTLPNSGIEIQIATRMITRLPDLVGETNAFYPPIQLESTFAEYLRGEDAALQYALSAE